MGSLVAVLLGIVQAVTEFLPVSSTAHLLLVGELLGESLGDPKFRAFVTIIQSGTTLAVLVYFREDLLAHRRGLAARAPRPEPLRDGRCAAGLVHRARDASGRGPRQAPRAAHRGARQRRDRLLAGLLGARHGRGGALRLPPARARRHHRPLGARHRRRPGARARARDVAVRQHHHHRHAARLLARGRRPLQLPPLRPHHPRRRRLQAREGAPRAARRARLAHRHADRDGGLGAWPGTWSSAGCSATCAPGPPTSSWPGGSRWACSWRCSSGRACSRPTTTRRPAPPAARAR